MARNSLSIDSKSHVIAINGVKGYFLSSNDYKVERLDLAPWETVLGPECIVRW